MINRVNEDITCFTDLLHSTSFVEGVHISTIKTRALAGLGEMGRAIFNAPGFHYFSYLERIYRSVGHIDPPSPSRVKESVCRL